MEDIFTEEELISVIVPVYNVEKYLPRCLQAISEQTYRNLEIILVDDGSTDLSGKLCDEFATKDSRARVIHQPNAGLWAARNAGHDAAHGDYLFFPDADDYFHRDMLRILHEAINNGVGYNLAICRMKRTEHWDEDVSSCLSVPFTERTPGELYQNLFKGESDARYTVFMWNKLFRGRLIKEMRTRNFLSEDKDYMTRLFAYLDKAVLVEYPLYYWFMRPDSLSHTRVWQFYYNSDTKMDYQNYLGLHDNPYSYYLLEELYARLLLWRHYAWHTPSRKTVVSESRNIVKNTWKAYIKKREIPIGKRMVCLFFALFPRCAHFVLVLAGN